MNEFWKKTLLFALVDIVLAASLLFDNGVVFTVFILWLLFQLVGGIILALSQKNKIIGQSLLASLGLFVLVGFSVCSIFFMSSNFH